MKAPGVARPVKPCGLQEDERGQPPGLPAAQADDAGAVDPRLANPQLDRGFVGIAAHQDFTNPFVSYSHDYSPYFRETLFPTARTVPAWRARRKSDGRPRPMSTPVR